MRKRRYIITCIQGVGDGLDQRISAQSLSENISDIAEWDVFLKTNVRCVRVMAVGPILRCTVGYSNGQIKKKKKITNYYIFNVFNVKKTIENNCQI